MAKAAIDICLRGMHMASPSVKVLIADDHPLITEGLTTNLARFDVEVVASVTEPERVAHEHIRAAPDVLVLDVRYGGATSGLDVARDLIAHFPGVRVIFFSQFDQDELLFEAYRLGAKGFVTKNSDTVVLADAIRQVHAGKTFFLPEIAERVAMAGLRDEHAPTRKLDARELEVFKRMARGHTNVEIAEALSLSSKTISTTSQIIKDKLGVSRSADITLLAVRCNLIKP